MAWSIAATRVFPEWRPFPHGGQLRRHDVSMPSDDTLGGTFRQGQLANRYKVDYLEDIFNPFGQEP